MGEFLRSLVAPDSQILWGIAPWRVGFAFAAVLLGFVSRGVIRWLFRMVGKRAAGTRFRWDEEAATLLPRPLSAVAQLLLWRLALVVLLLPTEPMDLRSMAAAGLDAAILVAVIWVLFRIVDVVALAAARWTAHTETRLDDQAIPLLRKTLKIFLALLGGVFVVQNLGYSITSVVAGLGIGGLAVALAAQDSVANFFGSVVLFTDAPFQVGDYVEVEDTSGTVEEVGFRTTRIRQLDSSLVSVPNKTFTATFITNYSARTGRLIAFDFGLLPGPSAAVLQEFVRDARGVFQESENIRADSVEVHLTGLGSGGIGVRSRAFTQYKGWAQFLETRERVLLGLLRVMEERGLTLARPVNTLVVGDAPTGTPPQSFTGSVNRPTP